MSSIQRKKSYLFSQTWIKEFNSVLLQPKKSRHGKRAEDCRKLEWPMNEGLQCNRSTANSRPFNKEGGSSSEI